MDNEEIKGEAMQASGMDGLEDIASAPITACQGIAAVALNLAIKYHDATIIKDGDLYRQILVEGRKIQQVDFDHVINLAIRIERHLVTSNERIAGIVFDNLEAALEEEKKAESGP